MKKLFAYLLMLLLLWNCDTKEPQPIDTPLPDETTQKAEPQPTEKLYSSAKQTQWESYYQSKIPNFDTEDFQQENAFKIERSPGTVTPIWDKKFNPVYKEFLAFNADSTQYVDIDSYKWSFDEKDELTIAPDQEIVLVNIPEKKVERLLFYGPSFWVEDAYFKNDSVVVLLENSTDRIPAYQEINLNQNQSQYYLYKKSLDFDSECFKNRIAQIYQESP